MTDGAAHVDPRSVLVVHTRYRQRAGEDAAVDAERAMLVARGHRVESLFADNRSIDDAAPAARVRAAAEAVWSSRAARRLREAVQAGSPSVVHVHNTFPLLSPSIFGELRRWGGPVVQSVHNYRFSCASANLFRDGHPCHDCLDAGVPLPGIVHACYRGSRAASGVAAGTILAARASDAQSAVHRFIAPSAVVRDVLVRSGVAAERIAIKPNFLAVDPGSFDGPRDGFLFAGRLSPEKGIATLLAAWRLLGDRYQLRVAGGGPLEDRVRVAAAAHASITYLGELEPSAVVEEMRRARALIFPSRWEEPFGLSIIEAYATGLPVIAGRIGAPAELVEDGVTGRLFDPDDAGALADVVRWAGDDADGLAEMGRAARRRFVERYTAEANYRTLLETYEAAATAAATARAARPS